MPPTTDTLLVTDQTSTPGYVHGHHASVLRSHGWRTAENSAGYLLAALRPTDRLLDVGTGPGTITVDLAGRLRDGEVVGIDTADTAVAATGALAAGRGLTNLRVQTADVHRLPFADRSFDVVHAHQVLQHLVDPVAALREMRRVRTDAGLVAVRDADYAAMTWHPAVPELTRWLELYHEVAGALGGEPDAGRRLGEWALLAGFTEVRATASVWCFSEPADLAWWCGTWADRLLQSEFGRQALDRGLSDQTELAALAAAWRAFPDRAGAWFATLHGEVLARG
jgi:SAM-dependent methyltransferase